MFGHSANRNQTEWNYILEAVDYIVSQIPIGESENRISVVIYSGSSYIAWKLDEYNDVASLRQVICNNSVNQEIYG